jgi:tRNA pseudouridine synthase 9
VSGNKVTEDYAIKGGDELSHTVHRHEPAVAVCDAVSSLSTNIKEIPWIKVVHEDDNVIAVDKPSTMPIHPCGGYNFNSLFHILAEQSPALKDNLYTIHRLDRLTSGLTLIAKSPAVAATYSKCISDRTCEKVRQARAHIPKQTDVFLNERAPILSSPISYPRALSRSSAPRLGLLGKSQGQVSSKF